MANDKLIVRRKLVIQPYSAELDAGNMLEWHENADIRAYFSWRSYKTQNDFQDFIEKRIKNGYKVFVAKFESGTKEVVCYCFVYNNIFSWLCNPKYRGNGYTAEMVSFVFDKLGLEKAVAHIDKTNKASQRVADKAGFICYSETEQKGKVIYEYIKSDQKWAL